MKFWLGSAVFLFATFVVMKLALADAQPAVATVATAAPSDDVTKALGRRAVDAFYRGDLAAFWQQCSDAMRGHFGSIDTLAAFRDKVQAQAGNERAIDSEAVVHEGDLRVYLRHARFEKSTPLVDVTLKLDARDRIVSFFIRPRAPTGPAPSTKLDYRTKTALRLPFDGTWAVGWGGRTLADNHHAANREQRFAYDLLVARGDSTHANDGKRNSDYFCYGRPILAPGAGTIVIAHDGVAENVPGQMNAQEVAGNYVVIDHGNGEFSFLAHLIPGSLSVHAGDRVGAGVLLGKCGNSGQSSEPHLHYHLQTTANLLDGEGLPAQFAHYLADGKPVTAGEPKRGQLISPAK